jgi:hypothetical protein
MEVKRATISILLLSCMAAGAAHATTAYEALRTIQKTRGQAVMSQLLEVRGETGMPQPQAWTILMKDADARSGIREFIIASADIRSERTPLRQYSGEENTAALDFARLNLDSDGAFKLAQSQAERMRAGFNSVDYVLRTDASTSGPVWDLRLFDHMGAPVGNMRISAVDGKLIQPLQLDADARIITESERPTQARTPEPASRPGTKAGRKPMGGVLGFVSRTAGNAAERTLDVSVRVVGTVEEVLTGERTIGREDAEATPTPTR